MKTIKVKCHVCGKEFDKPLNEYNRRIRLGKTKFYCDLSCYGKDSNSHLRKYDGKYKHNLKRGSDKDEFSPFREFIRCAKRRRETDIDLEYLKDLWEKQDGKCAITKIEMILERNHLPFQASLDRIDCSKGYVKGNVRFICLIANYARNKWDDEAVTQFIARASK